MSGRGDETGAAPQAREAWREAEHRYRTVADFTYDWEYWARLEGALAYVSPSCQRVTGYPADALMEDPSLLDEMVAPEDFPLWVNHRHACRSEEEAAELTFRIRRPDGQIRWVEHVCQPIFDGQGQCLGRRVSVRDVTQRRLADEALRTSEARYRAVVETQPDGFWVVDLQGRFVEVNDAYVRRSGYSRAELLSMRISDVEACEGTEQTQAHMALVQSRGVDVFESAHRAKDGTVFPVEVSASLWPIEEGRVFAFIRDIGRRKRAEFLLRARVELAEVAARAETDAVLQHALDAAELLTGSTIGFFHFVDEDQIHLDLQTWSSNTLRSMCTAEGKGRHYPIDEAGVWVDCARTRQPVIQNDYASLPRRKGLPAGHAPVTRELVVPILRDGRLVAILGVGNKSTDYTEDDVEPVRELASMAMDAVARKRTERALKESEARLETIFRNSLVGIGVVRLEDGRIVEVNDSFCTLFGYERDELLNQRSLDLGLWVNPEERSGQVARLRERGRTEDSEIHVRRKSGELRVLTLSAEVVSLNAEPHVIAVLSDVTDRRRAEKEMERLYGQARLDAETKSRLLMEVNHRVKNNLLSLQGMLLVEKRLAAEEGRQGSNASFDRLTGRLRGLLVAHDILSQREWAPVRVDELAERVVGGVIGRLASVGGFSLDVRSSDVVVSPRQAGTLAIILNELATNTGKYGEAPLEGARRVEVSAERAGGVVVVEYRDNGPGYPAAALAGESRGVGLRLLRELAQGTLGGDLSLCNDKGAVATIRLKVEDPGQT